MSKTLDARLLALETVSASPYAWPLLPGMKRLSVLILRGPNEQAELAHARAKGYEAELDTPENAARFMG